MHSRLGYVTTEMSAIPNFVADPTDGGTLWPNIEPEPSASDHFVPLFGLEFPLAAT